MSGSPRASVHHGCALRSLGMSMSHACRRPPGSPGLLVNLSPRVAATVYGVLVQYCNGVQLSLSPGLLPMKPLQREAGYQCSPDWVSSAPRGSGFVHALYLLGCLCPGHSPCPFCWRLLGVQKSLCQQRNANFQNHSVGKHTHSRAGSLLLGAHRWPNPKAVAIRSKQ